MPHGTFRARIKLEMQCMKVSLGYFQGKLGVSLRRAKTLEKCALNGEKRDRSELPSTFTVYQRILKGT